MTTSPMRRRGLIAVVACALVAALAGGPGPAAAQTWSGTWTAKPGLPSPPGARGWVDLIFDEAIGRSVLFGGSGTVYNNDIQQYNLAANAWTQWEPYVFCPAWHFPPTPRDEHAVEYDSVQRLYWTFGGSGFGCKGSTLVADAGTTTTLVVDAALSSSTVNFYLDWWVELQANGFKSLVTGYDPATKRLTLQTPITGLAPGASYLLYPQRGGGTYYYNPSTRTWTGLLNNHLWGYTGPVPSHRYSPAFAYSPADQVIVMFGGDQDGLTNETWVIDTVAKRWVKRISKGAPGSPPGVLQATNSMVYDSVHDVFVLFGGRCPPGVPGCTGAETWVYHYPTNTWTNRAPAVRPPARQQHTMVFDRHNGVTVLFGGSNGATELNDTWVYDYPTNTWSPVSTPTRPPGRRIGGMAYDSANHATVLYSGVKGGASLIALWDLWALTLVRSTGPGGPPTPPGIVLDNAPAGVADGSRSFTGTWCVSVAVNPFGPDSLFSCGSSGDTYRWRPTIASAGSYDVYVRWTQHVNRSTVVPISVQHASGLATRTFNEQTGGGAWVLHGRYTFNAGTGGYVQVAASAGQAAADAVRLVPVAAGSPTEIVIDNAPAGAADASRSFTGTWCVSGAVSPFGPDSLFSCGGGLDTYRWTPSIPGTGSYDVYVRWTQHVNRSTTVPIAVTHAGGTTARSFNEQTGGGAWVLHGRYTFNAGSSGFVQVNSSAGQAAADAIRLVPVP